MTAAPAPAPAPAPTFTPAFAPASAPAPTVAAVAVVAPASAPTSAGATVAAQRARGRWTRPVVRYRPLACTIERCHIIVSIFNTTGMNYTCIYIVINDFNKLLIFGKAG